MKEEVKKEEKKEEKEEEVKSNDNFFLFNYLSSFDLPASSTIMADFEAPFKLQSFMLWCYLRTAEILEESGLRYCIVGDAIAKILGYPLIISDLLLAVADEQLDAARSILITNHGFIEYPQINETFWDKRTTKEKGNQTGWPGCRLVIDINVHPRDPSLVLIPASYWHLDLVFYLDALIDVIIERFRQEELNISITAYFQTQYYYLLEILPKDVITRLPIEDQFFVDLFGKVMMPGARRKVCFQRNQIRAGLISPEDARASIPRKDLGLAAIKKKFREAAAKSTSPQTEGADVPKLVGPNHPTENDELSGN
ncbi:hypothetical protein FQN51_000418 [Onygenales sp. PD_10]|nr:hypothetical protein FQN51_000418 [Onygenales sp. PD_10]